MAENSKPRHIHVNSAPDNQRQQNDNHQQQQYPMAQPVNYDYNSVFANGGGGGPPTAPPPPAPPSALPHQPQCGDGQQMMTINTNNNNNNDPNANSIHWGSPTNPQQNQNYYQEGYNSMPPSLSDEAWHSNVFPPPPPQGTSYPFPTAPQGAQAPTMGFFQAGPTAMLAAPAGQNYNGNAPPATGVPMPPQPNFGGWTENREPEDGCNAREWCSMIFSLLVQTCVQIHIIFTALCSIEAPVTAVCVNYFYKKGFFGIQGQTNVAFIVVVSVTAFFYLLDCVFNPFRHYVHNCRNRIDTYSFLAKLADTRPELWFHIQCYHYETRHYTDSKGRSQTRQVRVNTHSAKGNFGFSSWRNIGPPPLIAAQKAMRIRLDKEFVFADEETRNAYESDFASFIAANDRDTHKDVSSGFEIDGFEDYFLSMIRDQPGETSFHWFCFNSSWYWICVFTLMSAYYRIVLAVGTFSMDYSYIKEVKK